MFDFLGAIPLLYVHLGTLTLLVPLILFADHQGFEWLTGKKHTLDARVIQRVHVLTGIGLTIMILSGVFLAWPYRTHLLSNAAFYVKIIFVLILTINSFFIGKLMHIATARSFASLSFSERIPFFVSGGLSTLGWGGAALSAVFMGFGNLEAIFGLFF